MDIFIIAILVVAAVILFLVELFIIPGISIAGFLAGGCIIYANYYAFANLGATAGFITLAISVITCCVSTKRVVLTLPDDTPEAALVRSVAISDALQSCVGRLTASPAFVVAKGGITSSDVGVKALRVKCAKVLGQIRPGIPVWQTGAESLFPGTPYIIFPGNVGEVPTLREAVEILLG